MKRLEQKGVTLVALVVTIIILLILAGITITLTLGDKGIINMAKEAGKNYQDAAAYEQNLLKNLADEANSTINENSAEKIDYTKVFDSLEYVKQSSILTSAGTTPSSEKITLEQGNYILVGTGRNVEYDSTLSLTGSNEIKEVGWFHTGIYSTGLSYVNGRGRSVTKVWTLSTKENVDITFSIANTHSNYASVGSLGIYQFK